MKIVELNKSVSKLSKKEKIYIASFVGGIDVTTAEKEVSLDVIRQAIFNNMNGNFTHIDVEHFSYGYPESMHLVADYFDSYKELCTTEEEDVLRNNERRYTMLFFTPIFMECDSKEEVEKYCEILSLNSSDLAVAKKQHEMLSFDIDKYSKSDDGSSMLELINEIENAVLLENKNKYQIYEEYGIDEKCLEQCVVLSKYCDELSNCLINNSFGYYNSLEELYEIIPGYLKNGIQVGDNNLRFTLIDYYYLTEQKPQQFIDYYKNTDMARADKNSMKLLSMLARSNRYLGMAVDSEKIVKAGFKFGFAGKEVSIDKDIADELIALFNKYNIPKRDGLIQLAAGRYAKGEPVLPLAELSKEKENDVEKVLTYKKR